MHISAVVDILPGNRGTYIWGGMYFWGIAADSKFLKKMKGTYFRRGIYLRGFTVVTDKGHCCRENVFCTSYMGQEVFVCPNRNFVLMSM